MTNSLEHRGPDDQGCLILDGGVGLGNRRLSIIDLSSDAHQPMRHGTHPLWITFNGEIYNYRELRSELRSRGHFFRTASDTEVILAAFDEWGIDCVDRLRGMFAFALWDGLQNVFYLVRDRLGVKPLYYYLDDELLLFGSELRSLINHPRFRREVSQAATATYLRLGYVPRTETLFHRTAKVAPGSWIEFCAPDRPKTTRYWSTRIGPQQGMVPDPVADGSLRCAVIEAVRYRLVSDVKVGVLLSGGVDSALVASVICRELDQPIDTFTLAFPGSAADESTAAAEVAARLGTTHHTYSCDEADALTMLEQLPEIYDEPIADPSTIPTSLLCREVGRELKVVLSGDGGDEVFAGYRAYATFERLWRARSRLNGGASRHLARVLKAVSSGGIRFGSDRVEAVERLLHRAAKTADVVAALSPASGYESVVGIWGADELAGIGPDPSHPFETFEDPFLSLQDLMMMIDISTYLPDNLLVKIDRAGMAFGLEVREPLLDHELVELGVSIPAAIKTSRATSKVLLRELLRSYLPGHMVDQPKHGFSPPLERWLRGAFYGQAHDQLQPARLEETGIASPGIRAGAARFLRGRPISSRKIWCLLSYQLWHERWVQRQPVS